MYLQSGVILGISFLLAIIGDPFSATISWGMKAVVGIFDNYFFMYDLEKRIGKGKMFKNQQNIITFRSMEM